MKVKKILYCSVEGCNNDFYAKGYCRRHYDQNKKSGIITNHFRGDKNKHIIKGNIAILELYDKRRNVVGYTIIDKEDLEKTLKYKWYMTSYKYVATTLKNHKNLFLHRYITNCPDNKVVDHINHKTTDNRKSNLKVCSQKENLLNKNIEVKGITTIKRNENTYYILQLKGKYLGCFKSLLEAEEKKKSYL